MLRFIGGPFLSYSMWCSLPIRRCAGGLALFLAWFAAANFGAAVAHATCGDWLAHPGHSMSPAVAEQSESTSKHEGALAERSADPDGRSHRAPCSGPECRGAPHNPLPPAPPTLVNPSDRLLLVGLTILGDEGGRSPFLDSESAPHGMRGFPVAIEHPPRS